MDVLSADTLMAIDVLFVTNADNFGIGAEFTNAISPVLQDWVNAGGVLVVHDRHVDNDVYPDGQDLLFGVEGLTLATRSFSDAENIEFVDDNGPLANGPGGPLNDFSLDGGNFSSHGYISVDPAAADDVEILLTNGSPDQAVTVKVQHGQGSVIYSTIPLDFYLSGVNAGLSGAFQAYAANVVAYAVELAGEGGGDPEPTSPYSVSAVPTARLEGTFAFTDFTFVASRTGDASQEVTLKYAVNPFGINPIDSFDLFNNDDSYEGLVTFAAGSSTATFTVQVRGDTIREENETFKVTLFDPLDAVADDAIGLIINDDLPINWQIGRNFGDPHLVSLDGLGYDMQAVGEFVLLRSTAGNPFEVQVRTGAVNAFASEILSTAITIGDSVIELNDGGLLVDGVGTVIDPAAGFLVVGDGQVVLGEANGYTTYTIFIPGGDAAVIVTDFGDRYDVNVSVNPDRAGQFEGLLGNFDGNLTNDFALRDGTILPQPIDFETFYGEYVNDWRISNEESLFFYGEGEDTSTFTDLAFPAAVVNLDDFPADVVAAAMAAAAAKGITDPGLVEAAVLDFLLTGDETFLDGAAAGPEPEAVVAPGDAPSPDASFGIGALTLSAAEGTGSTTTFEFTLYRTSGEGMATVGWSVSSATADATDFGGTLPIGIVEFAEGQTEAVISIAVTADAEVEANERFTVTITPPEGSLILAASASATILNDDVPLILGTEGANTLTGTVNNDVIRGLGGADIINGGGGDDVIDGGRGNDTMSGGSGADMFLFDNSVVTGKDKILDFDISDTLLFTVKLRDNDDDGIITFGSDRRLDTSTDANDIAMTNSSGARITAVEYDGLVEYNGVQYFAYSLIGDPILA
jgi:hypothetical protein